MDGVDVKITINGDDALIALSKKLLSVDKNELLKGFGQEMVEAAKDHIENKMDVSGVPFKPWAESTKKSIASAKGRHGSARDILRDNMDLFNSLTWQIVGSALIYGTNMVYSAVQNYGYAEKKIPARQYVGIGMEEEHRIKGILNAELGALD